MSTEKMSAKKENEIAAKLVNDFNERYKVGDEVLWRSTNDPFSRYAKKTIRTPAILLGSTPVVFFENHKGCCSIEPEFLKHVLPVCDECGSEIRETKCNSAYCID